MTTKKRIWIILFFVVFAFTPKFSGSGEEIFLKPKIDYPNKHAILIGVSKYQKNSGYQPLGDTPNSDVVEIASVLSSRFGFQVHLLMDQKTDDERLALENVLVKETITLQDIEDLLAECKKVAPGEDALLFFFAGHGDNKGKNTSDNEGNIVTGDGGKKSLADIAKILHNKKARHTLMILDCCYSGNVLNANLKDTLEKLGPKITEITDEGNTSIIRDLNRSAFQIITAGAENELVENKTEEIRLSYLKDKHSPFTSYLLLALNGMEGDEDGVLRASQLGEYIVRSVDALKTGKQTPRYDWIQGQGNFLFIPQQSVINPRILAGFALEDEKYAQMWITSCESMVTFIKDSEEKASLIKTAIPYLDFCLKRNIGRGTFLLNEKDDVLESYTTTAQSIIELIKLNQIRENYFNEIHQSSINILNKLHTLSMDEISKLTNKEQDLLHDLEENCAEIIGRLPLLANNDSVRYLKDYVSKIKGGWEEEIQEIGTRENAFYGIVQQEKDYYYNQAIKSTEQFNSFFKQKELSVTQNLEEYWILFENLEKKAKFLQKSEEYNNNLKEQTKCLESCCKLYKWLNQQGMGIINDYVNHRRLEHIKGQKFLQEAKKLLQEKRIFDAKLTAARAIGFDGFGTLEKYPPLLEKNSKDYVAALNIVLAGPGYRLLWQSPISLHHSSDVTSVAYSPDGKTIASSSSDRTIKLWNTITHKEIATLSTFSFNIRNVVYSPNSKTLAFASNSKTIGLWDTIAQREIATFSNHSDIVTSVAYSPNGKTLASSSNDRTIRLWDTIAQREIAILSGHSSNVTSVAYNPDGKTLASSSWDRTIRLWDTTTHKEIATLSGHLDIVTSVAYSPNGKTLASSSNDRTIRLWDTIAQREIAILSGHSSNVTSVAYNPDGKTLASASSDRTVRLWDTTTHKEIAIFSGHFNKNHSSNIISVVYSPDGKTLACSWDRTIRLWDTTTHKEIAAPLLGHSDGVNSVAYSPDGKTLASASSDKTIKLWDVNTHKEIAILSGHSNAVNSVAYSPNGKTFASASSDKTIKLWDVNTHKEIAILSGHSNAVNSVAYSPNGKTFASASSDKTIKLWDVSTHKEIATLSGHSNAVTSIAYSPDCKTLASSDNRTIKLWDVISHKEIATLSGHSSVTSIAYSPDCKTLAFVSQVTIKLWDVISHKEIATLSGYIPSGTIIAYSPDGKTLASASRDNTVKLWDVIRREEIATFSAHSDKWRTSNFASVAYSPDGKTLASASWDNTIKLWDVTNNDETFTLSGHSSNVTSIAYSPDGKTLASASWDNTIKLWNTVTHREIATLSGHSGYVTSVAYSPDGKTLASASWDNTIKLWNTVAHREITTLSGHSANKPYSYITSIAYSPDGKTLASASRDNTIKLWDVIRHKQIETLSNHSDSVNSIAYSPDGKTLASASRDNTIKLWDVAGHKEITTLDIISPFSVAYSPDGKTLAFACADKTIKLWDVVGRKEITTLYFELGVQDVFWGRDEFNVFSVAYSPDGKTLATASADLCIKLWDAISHKEIANFYGHSGYVTSVTYSPDGKTLAFAQSRTIKHWNISSKNYAKYMKICYFDDVNIVWRNTTDSLIDLLEMDAPED